MTYSLYMAAEILRQSPILIGPPLLLATLYDATVGEIPEINVSEYTSFGGFNDLDGPFDNPEVFDVGTPPFTAIEEIGFLPPLEPPETPVESPGFSYPEIDITNPGFTPTESDWKEQVYASRSEDFDEIRKELKSVEHYKDKVREAKYNFEMEFKRQLRRYPTESEISEWKANNKYQKFADKHLANAYSKFQAAIEGGNKK